MTETSSLWRVAKRELSPYGVFHRVENRVDFGTPDVVYALRCPALGRGSGVIEMKWLPRPPARPETPLRIASLSLDQVLFAEGWERAGGDAWLLLQVARAYMLLPGAALRAIYDRTWTLREVRTRATVAKDGAFPAREIAWALCQKARNPLM